MTYIPWSSDFALYLEDCLMYEHHTSGPVFALYLEDYLIYEHCTLGYESV